MNFESTESGNDNEFVVEEKHNTKDHYSFPTCIIMLILYITLAVHLIKKLGFHKMRMGHIKSENSVDKMRKKHGYTKAPLQLVHEEVIKETGDKWTWVHPLVKESPVSKMIFIFFAI